MAEVLGFRGLRYDLRVVGDPQGVVAPPYDVIDAEERERLYGRHPHNVTRVDLPVPLYGTPEGGDPLAPYRHGGAVFRRWTADGVLKVDPAPSVYVYEEGYELPDGSRKRLRGLLARVRLHPFEDRVILPHEYTLPKAKLDRFRQLQAYRANLSPIFAFYSDAGGESAALLDRPDGEPVTDFVDEAGIRQRMWPLADPQALSAIRGAFAPKQLFIADGHHRYETALAYRDERVAAADAPVTGNEGYHYALMMLVPIESGGLTVLPIHRAVRGVEPERLRGWEDRAKGLFELERIAVPSGAPGPLEAAVERLGRGRSAFGLYTGGGEGVIVALRDARSMADRVGDVHDAAWRGLDVAVLHTLFLQDVLGIQTEGAGAEEHLAFYKEAREATRQVDTGEAQLAVVLRPTRLEQIRDVALDGEKMPQKSTYFYPKLLTGLVMHDLDEPAR